MAFFPFPPSTYVSSKYIVLYMILLLCESLAQLVFHEQKRQKAGDALPPTSQ